MSSATICFYFPHLPFYVYNYNCILLLSHYCQLNRQPPMSSAVFYLILVPFSLKSPSLKTMILTKVLRMQPSISKYVCTPPYLLTFLFINGAYLHHIMICIFLKCVLMTTTITFHARVQPEHFNYFKRRCLLTSKQLQLPTCRQRALQHSYRSCWLRLRRASVSKPVEVNLVINVRGTC